MRDYQNETPAFLWVFFFFILTPAAGNQKCFKMLLSAGCKFLFSMDNVQKISTPKVRGKKNFLGVLEKTQEPLKCFVHSEPQHIWGCESRRKNHVQKVPSELR